MADTKTEDEKAGITTSIDEYEDRFNEIDATLEAFRSSIKDDVNDIPDTNSMASSLNAPSVITIDRVSESNEQITESKKSSPLAILAVLIPIILAFFVGQKLSSSPSPVIDTPQTLNNGRTINYEEKRKVEKCRYDVNGERICESDEQSVSSSSPGGSGGQRVFHQATFQKCRYVNGKSYCESLQQELSSGGDAKHQFSKKQLVDEFRAADVNQDGQVSRPEFERYKKLYLQQYPDTESTFAKFEDFDSDSNGLISANEHEGYYKALGLL